LAILRYDAAHEVNHGKDTLITNINLTPVTFVSLKKKMLPEPNFPVQPDEFIGRRPEIEAFQLPLQLRDRQSPLRSSTRASDYSPISLQMLTPLPSGLPWGKYNTP
jgi:hypothetical protein